MSSENTNSEAALPATTRSDWIAATVGFRATKGFREARRAQRPVVGDRFRSVRDRGRMEVVVDAVDWHGMVLFTRFVEEEQHEEKCRADRAMWPHCVIGALRRGAEFIPAAHSNL